MFTRYCCLFQYTFTSLASESLSRRTHTSSRKAATRLVSHYWKSCWITYPRMVVIKLLLTANLVARPRLPRTHALRIRRVGCQSAPVATLGSKRKVHLLVLRAVRYPQVTHASELHASIVNTTRTLGVPNSCNAVVVFDAVEHAQHLVVPAFSRRVKTLLKELQLERAESWSVV